MRAFTRLIVPAALACCAACSPPVDPPDERPPEPQVGAVHDAILAPIDAARAVGNTLQEAADRRSDEAEAAAP
ncbi:hypothetical protein E2F46_02945 [Luteimonas aestuarii]|uniref:Lipoprotein n=1 Tax=Luteimonas aestuarii TaxID=453837 RepID=A0A4R5U0V9_9GAMM|nr:hypothetical protein [Luteimonas aestuarii]TDK27184.1 hypothetical protein E2F46_02945 [Luteimonas aestuarii]